MGLGYFGRDFNLFAWVLLAALVGITSHSYAELSGAAEIIPTKPSNEDRDELIREAESPDLSKEGYLRVIRKIKKRIPKKPYAAQNPKEAQILVDWIDGLDRLFAAGKIVGPGRNFQFLTPHEELVELSQMITEAAATVINFTDFDDDNFDFVRTFYKWSEGYTRVFVADGQKYFVIDDIRRIKDPVKLKKKMELWHQRLAMACDILEEIKAPAAALGIDFVVNTRTSVEHYEALGLVDSIVIGQLLSKNAEIIPSEVDELVKNCLAEPSVGKALKRLLIAATNAKEGVVLPKLVEWSLILSSRLDYLENIGIDVDDGLRDQAGTVLVTALEKLLTNGESLPLKNVVPIVNTLKAARQVNYLAATLAEGFQTNFLADNQLDFVYQLSEGLSRSGQIQDPYSLFKDFHQRTLVQKKRRELGWEGTYDIKIGGNREPATMTLAFTGALGQNFVVSIVKDDAGQTSWSYSKVIYIPEEDQFVAYKDELEKVLSFSLKPQVIVVNGREQIVVDPLTKIPMNEIVNGEFERFGETGPRLLAGTQTRTVPILPLANQNIPWKPIDALFTGKSRGERISLRLQEKGGVLTMAMIYPYASPRSHAYFPFKTAILDRPKRLGFFTTPELSPSDKVVQLRGIFSKDGNTFDGYHMIGGQGFNHVTLTRQ
jgi:hypothetical protein